VNVEEATLAKQAGFKLCGLVNVRKHSLQEGLLEKSKQAQHAYEEGRSVGWDEARILDIESNSRYVKYKESTHIACLTNLIS
jgi:hypothetical protein